MKKVSKALAITALLAASTQAHATPSTTWWTPATTYVQPYLVPHVTYDTYFGETSSYPVDTGLTMGILPFEKLQAEIGFDLMYGAPFNLKGKAPLLLNGKLGVPEGAFGAWFPGISAGIYGVGFQKDVSDYNILHAEIGKTLGSFGTLTVGGYYGLNDKLFVDIKADGSTAKAQSGLLAAYLTPDVTVGLPGLTKVNFFADLQTGKNAYGAWGFGAGIYFTPAIDILTGPVFFLNERTQPGGSKFLWSVQLDVDIELLAKPKS